MIRIFTDTSANLPTSLISRHGIEVVPFSYTVNGEPGTLDGKEFYEAMRQGAMVKTSMVNIATFMTPMREALERGEDVLYIGMSGGISGTAHAATVATSELREEFPDRRIAAVDTLAASLGEGLLVLKAVAWRDEGKDFSEICERLEDEKKRMCQYFTVDDLEYLKRGGRISKLASVVGTVLKIKPILTGDHEGKIILCGKARGRRQALLSLAEHYERLVTDKTAIIGIAHGDDESSAQELLEMLRERGFSGECLTEIYEPVTGSHVGPGTVALFFMGTHK